MFVLPMDAEGVTVRGLRQISGEAEFNEVFLDDVRLPADAVVGQVNDGWRTALTTLMFERVTIGLGSEGMATRRTASRGPSPPTPTPAATPRSASAWARSRSTCWPSSSPATGR
jgi:hypothetical protein